MGQDGAPMATSSANGPALRVAAWSCPRTVSTALMRSFGNRPDTAVCDEPLYAHYLASTGRPHPGADEIVAQHESDWRAVARWLTGPVPGGRRVFYQKHMAHHLLDDVERDWLWEIERHFFLIRAPRELLPSLDAVTPRPTLADTGFPQLFELFEAVRARTGVAPPVVDARDLLLAPRAVLVELCAALGLAFDQAMLAWPPGPRASDGVWARHWYASVERSTGFGPYRAKTGPLPQHLAELCEQCARPYETLHRHRIQAS